MKTALSFCALALLLLMITPNTSADIAKPKPAPQKEPKFILHTGLEIAVDQKGSQARLQIRESDLKELRAALDGVGSNRNLATTITGSSTRTIVAGVLLFMSISIAGVWVARSKRSGAPVGRGQKTLVIALLCVSVLGAAAIITRGNVGPPPSVRWRNLPENMKKGESTIGSVNLEVVDDADGGSGIKLIIPLQKSGPGD